MYKNLDNLLKKIVLIVCLLLPFVNLLVNSIPIIIMSDLEDKPLEMNELRNEIPFSSAELVSKTGYAIIVGISDYPGTSSDLSYCDDDALAIYSILLDEFNFKSENVYYLQDSEASLQGISNAFDEVANQIGPDDVFFFYYSGHGGASTTNGGVHSYSIDSPHPYSNYYDHMWSIYHEDAAYMRVHFDALSLEYGCDYVYLGDTDLADGWYYEDYTGSQGAFWSGWIPLLSDNRIYIRMITDYSITANGFSIDQYEVEVYNGTHFLCSYDSIPYDPEYFYLDTLLDSKLDSLNCDETYVVLDACNTGGMINEIQQNDRYIMTACTDEESSLESSNLGHGVFTNYFLNSLEYSVDGNDDGAKSFEEMYTYTYSNAVSYSTSLGYTHHPQESDGISGEAVLETAIGGLYLNKTANSLNYSFSLYGTGEIEELYLCICEVTDSVLYQTHDLMEDSISNTGFENYSGIMTLSGASDLTGYGLFARIEGNNVIIWNYTDSADYDGDSLSDVVEVSKGLNPRTGDTDSDGLGDEEEYFGLTNPLDPDCDNDDLTDGQEINIYYTDPLNPDSDGDNINDGLEVMLGLDPLDSHINLLTFILNIAGFVIIISTAGYAIVKTIKTTKKKSMKSIPKKFIEGSYNTQNVLMVEKKDRPVSRYSSYYTRSPVQQMEVTTNEIRNIILYKTPLPKQHDSNEGKYAIFVSNQAFLALKQGKANEALNLFVKSLMLGVPEPYNTQIKNMLLQTLDQVPTSNQTLVQDGQKLKFCTYCGAQNLITSKFCRKCGRGM
jgi:ribosomal protein L40E